MIYKEERPWGWFEILYQEPQLKVKRILVKPGKRLSLQSHSSRSENWVIIQGKALIQVHEQEKAYEENQAVFIPMQAKHRISNPDKHDLIFIEVQTGSYLGEDDITRYQDDFNRN
jgi:mannose-6-phosphate isomerase-like protein (cupin superfamily)